MIKNLNSIALTVTFSVAILALSAGIALGADSPVEQRLELAATSEPVVKMGDVVITHGELDAHINELPSDSRAQAVSSMERIDQMLQGLLLKKALYEAAVENGLLDEPELTFQALYAAADKLASEEMKRRVESRKLDNYEKQARELFLSQPDSFRPAPSYDFTHVLVSTTDRSEADAMERILEVHNQIKDGVDLEELIEEYSEDDASTDSKGAYRNAELDSLDRNFSRALSRLEEPGDVSGPVRSRFGWHIIRLDARNEPPQPEWEDVRDEAVETARKQHERRIRETYIDELLDGDAVDVVPGSIEVFQKRHGFDPEALRRESPSTE